MAVKCRQSLQLQIRYDKDADVYVCPGGQRLYFYYFSAREGMTMRIYRCQKGVCFSCQFFNTECTVIEWTVHLALGA